MARKTPGQMTVSEAGKKVTITAKRTGGGSGAVDVSYATSDGTATAGSDYTANSGKLSWADGDKAKKSFTILIANDALDESDETITVSLTEPTGGAILAAPNSGIITIKDNDPAP